MSASAPDDGAAEPGRTGTRRYARLWAREVARLGFVPISSTETERLLLGHTATLARAVLAEPFTAGPAYQVGRALVDAHLTDPGIADWAVRALGTELFAEVLGESTAVVLGESMAGASGGPPPVGERIAHLQGALAGGFAGALRERTLREQEQIARSAWDARDEVEQALRDSEARFRAVFTGAAIGIGIGDLDGQILDVNQAFADLLGYTVAEMRQINVASLFHPDDAAGMWELYRDLLEGKIDSARVEKRYYRKDGNFVWTDLAVSLIRHDDGRPRFTVAMVEDITERYELQQRLRFQATHDPLTGLPNRTLFFERLAAVFASPAAGERVGVCFLDLDGFKAINDTFGHDIGDRLLVVIAQRLSDRVWRHGHPVARMGGDEFVIMVCDSTGRQDVIAVAEAVLAAVAAPVQIDDQQLVVTASIGVVEGPVADTSASELMKAADTTLYWAKAEGRGRWALHDPVRNARDLATAALAARLPAALERDELEVDYQPIVAFGDGTMVAVEALVRWRHPERGLLGPDRFIGLAEETGLICQLGGWVLERACEDAAEWLRAFPDARLVVSVNLAARQASDPGIVATVSAALDRTGLPADLLQLELTESALMATAGEPLRILRRLAGLGVRLAIDDFGTGYSNLAYLRRMPIRALKLAGPFIEGLRPGVPPGQYDEHIVDALVRLAHALGLSVTAEAVETPEQETMLRSLGCDTGQGRFFGAPTTAAEITARLRG